MGITQKCQVAMNEHGVVTVELDDGTHVPAGHKLMLKDVVRVALIDTDKDGKLPAQFYKFVKSELDNEHYQDELEYLERPHSLPLRAKGAVRDAIGHWQDSQIEFVAFDDNPDIAMFFYEQNTLMRDDSYGFATFPENDHGLVKDHVAAVPIIGVGISDYFLERVWNFMSGERVNTIAHEYGHAALGIMHPRIAEQSLKKYMEAHGDLVCSEHDLAELRKNAQDSVMENPRKKGRSSAFDEGVSRLLKDVQPIADSVSIIKNNM